MIEIKEITIKTKKEREIVKDLSLVVNEQDRLAIIGEEGNGKSTVLKCIYDQNLITSYATVTGKIVKNNCLMGYLEQFLSSKWEEQLVLEYFLKEKPEGEIEYEKYNQLYQIEKIFRKLKLPVEYLQQDKKINTLSGGEKVKMQLANMLLKNPDILLLDEPTNDLDLDTLEWLEDFLIHLTIPVIFVSHDEVVLKKVANRILHLEQVENKTQSKYTYAKMGYEEYVQTRRDRIDQQEQIAKNEKREYDKQMERYQRQYQQVQSDLEGVSRQEPGKGRLLKKKMKSVKNVGKHLEEKELTQRPYVEEAILAKFHQENTIYASKVILDLQFPVLAVEEKELSKNIKLVVVGKQKIVIVGKNGSGKTTLLKKIEEELKNRKDIIVGYMPQQYEEQLPKNSSAVEFLKQTGTREEETLARTYLGSMKFTKEEMLTKIENLSGGQKAKLLLVKLIMQKCNVLLLDEPTRNLSPLSVPVINQLLKEFEGTIISVSHDRMYIQEVANTVYTLQENGLKKEREELV